MNSSGQSVDGKSTIPSIELNTDQCEILHQSVRNQFQSLLETHCPKVEHFIFH